VLGLLHDAVHGEVNGCSDSPLVFADSGEMVSTPNFHTPMIAVAADALAIALVQLSAASVQRIIKLQTPQLSGLPRYLSPVGGASVGFNALQKTAAALHAQVRLHAAPAALDAFPVSDTVEDHAPQTPLALRKLDASLHALRHLVAIEALVAAQAVDLRQAGGLGQGTRLLHAAVREVVPALAEDRPPGADVMRVEAALFAGPLDKALQALAMGAEDSESLRHLL
jgi:histidine ammonia-lyase